jgi:soluble lytic murein transglycosylase-like protein
MSSAILLAGFLAWFIAKQFGGKPERMAVAEVRAIIKRLNLAEFSNRFDVADILAIVEIESAFNARAYRSEPRIDDASIGLMQTLYSTALDRGLEGGPAALFDPTTNIRMGMRHLKWGTNYLEQHLGRAPTEDERIGAYNAGVGSVVRGRVPLTYVSRWREARARYVA